MDHIGGPRTDQILGDTKLHHLQFPWPSYLGQKQDMGQRMEWRQHHRPSTKISTCPSRMLANMLKHMDDQQSPIYHLDFRQVAGTICANYPILSTPILTESDEHPCLARKYWNRGLGLLVLAKTEYRNWTFRTHIAACTILSGRLLRTPNSLRGL